MALSEETKTIDENNDKEISSRGDVCFTNWSKTFSCFPFRSFYPTSEAQVKRIVEIAQQSSKKIRVVGGGLSPSDLVCTQDFLIYTNKLDKILEVDHEKLLVRVQAGIKISQLNKELGDIGLALSNIASISSQTLAGAIGSCTHGTGIKFGSISTQIKQVVFIDALGNRRVATDEEVEPGQAAEESEIYKAILCHLGCLGILVELTLKVEPAFNLEIRQYPQNLFSVLENLSALLESGDHVRLWWHPHVSSTNEDSDIFTNDTLVWSASRTSNKITSPKTSWFWDNLVRVKIFEFLLFCGRYFKSIIPMVNKTYFTWFSSHPKKEVKKSYEAFNFDCLFSQHVSEWAIPINKTKEALTLLAKLLNNQNSLSSNKVNAHFPVEIRFVQKDDIFLSPAYGQDICYIGIIMYRPYDFDVEYKSYWNSFEDIMISLGGRPHWAKAHPLTPSQLKGLYPEMETFLKVRSKMDPKKMFVNEYIQRHFLGSI